MPIAKGDHVHDGLTGCAARDVAHDSVFELVDVQRGRVDIHIRHARDLIEQAALTFDPLDNRAARRERMNPSRLSVTPLEHVIRAVEEEHFNLRPPRAHSFDGFRKALEKMLLPCIHGQCDLVDPTRSGGT